MSFRLRAWAPGHRRYLGFRPPWALFAGSGQLRTYSKSSDSSLEFLMQGQYLPTEAGPSAVDWNNRDVSTSIAQNRSKKISFERQVSQLRAAVLCKDTPRAEAIFNESPDLKSAPKALRWMLRNYGLVYDFTTAKAFLLQVFNSIGSKGIYQFMKSCFRVSENTADLDEVFWRSTKLNLTRAEHEALAATAIFGFKILQDHEAVRKVHQYVVKRGLEWSPAVLQTKVYDLYISGDFGQALQLGRTLLARQEEISRSSSPAPPDQVSFNAQAPYRWAVAHFARAGDIKSIDVVAEHMKSLGLTFPTALTNTLLSHLPALYPEFSMIDWFKLCEEKGLPLNLASFSILVDRLAQMYPALGDELREYRRARLSDIEDALPAGKWDGERRPEPKLHSRHGTFMAQLRGHVFSKHPVGGVEVLDAMRRQGIVPPYSYYVLLFESVAARGNPPDLDTVKSRFATVGYPLHCAGTDLAMLEAHVPRLQSPGVVRQLLDDYLTQYPLHQRDRVQLTRIARLFAEYADDPDQGLNVVDFLRLGTPDHVYTVRNHDSVSLQLVLELRSRLRMRIESWVNDILRDRPLVLLDDWFQQQLVRLLKASEHPADNTAADLVLQKVRVHNSWVANQVVLQVDGLARHLESTYCVN